MGARPKPGPVPRKNYLYCSHCHQEKMIGYKIDDPTTPLTSDQIADAVRVKRETKHYPKDIMFNFYPAASYTRGFTYCCMDCSQASATASLEKKKAIELQKSTPVENTSWDPHPQSQPQTPETPK